jgi:hypothetical protein
MNSRDILKGFANKKSKFFDLRDGEESVVKFLFVELVTTHFNNKPVDCIRYHFEVSGKEMLWDRPHRELAIQMAQFSEGDLISIKRTGEKNKTKYLVKRIDQ